MGDARLKTGPTRSTRSMEPGRHALGLREGERDGILFVPSWYSPEVPAPLVVLLHGAGGGASTSEGWLPLLDELGIIALVPDSQWRTWDMIVAAFGPDVEFLDRALAHVFERCAVDPERIAVGGFSDGASYALSIGLANGSLFRDVLAFSPGFMAPSHRRGSPRIFVSHGTQDPVLPIARTSRRIVPQLQDDRYDVTYREFDGGHTVPAELAREGFHRVAGVRG